jgi:hypothetical protein
MMTRPYKVFQWNGKDLFLQSCEHEDDFIVMSFGELTEESRNQLDRDKQHGVADREIMLTAGKQIAFKLTPEEIEVNRIRRHHVANLLAKIAAIEGSDIPPAHANAKLTMLRAELAQLIPVDPTAITSEQRRANNSITMVDFQVKQENK